MVEPRSSFVEANGIRLHYLEWEPSSTVSTYSNSKNDDHDNIPLVLLHSVAATADSWRLAAPYLNQEHRVIAFDLRGHGESDQPDEGYTLESIAEDIVQGMAALGLGKVALIGHSWGARVAMVLASRHPALVSHLMFVDGAYMEPRFWPGMTRERYVHQKASRAYTLKTREDVITALRQDMAPFWSVEVEPLLLKGIRELPDGTIEESLRPANQVRIRESLWDDRALPYYSKIKCPVLLLLATILPQTWEETLEEVECMEEFVRAKGEMATQVARAMQCCTVIWMPGTTHDIQLHRPQALAEIALSFLKEYAQ